MSQTELTETAYHESGHIIASIEMDWSFDTASIEKNGEVAGFVRLDFSPLKLYNILDKEINISIINNMFGQDNEINIQKVFTVLMHYDIFDSARWLKKILCKTLMINMSGMVSQSIYLGAITWIESQHNFIELVDRWFESSTYSGTNDKNILLLNNAAQDFMDSLNLLGEDSYPKLIDKCVFIYDIVKQSKKMLHTNWKSVQELAEYLLKHKTISEPEAIKIAKKLKLL